MMNANVTWKMSVVVAAVMLTSGVGARQSKTLYVRAGATGSCTGDWNNACGALATAETAAVRGDTIYVADGTYGSVTFDAPASGTTRITLRKATEADHGTDTGWSSAFGDGVAVLTGITIATSYITIDGQVGGGPGSWRSGHGFKIQMPANSKGIRINAAVTGLLVQHVEVAGDHDGSATGGDGIYACCSTVTGTHLRHVWVHDTSRTNLLARHSAGWIVEYSLFERPNTVAGVHSEIWSVSDGSPNNWTVRYNVIADPVSTGGIITSGFGWKFYGNLFTTTRTSSSVGNGLIGGWTAGPGGNHLVYNNTFAKFYSTNGRLFPVAGGSGSVVRNNLFCDVANFTNAASTKSHNAFRNTTIPNGETDAQTLSVACSEIFAVYGGSTWSPSDDYRLKGATLSGLALSSEFDTDPAGLTRGADGVWDRGAYEFQSGGTTAPAAPTNVRIVGSARSREGERDNHA